MRAPLHTFRSNMVQSDVAMTFQCHGLKRGESGACCLHIRNGRHGAFCRACSCNCANLYAADSFRDHLMTSLFSSGKVCVRALQCQHSDSAFESQGLHADIQSLVHLGVIDVIEVLLLHDDQVCSLPKLSLKSDSDLHVHHVLNNL